MTLRAVGIVGLLVVLAGLVWVLVPPFPSPETLLDKSLQALTMQLGSSVEVTLPVPAPLRGGKTIGWEKSRGIAVWELQADWTKPPADPQLPPDMVSRCLRIKWAPAWVGVLLPCQAVARARVMASNNRWRGP